MHVDTGSAIGDHHAMSGDEAPGPSDLTQLLGDAAAGVDVSRSLFDAVYSELRAIAHHRMVGERAGHTLQTTALVHEAYLRLVQGPQVAWEGRAHFYAAAAEAMRRILVDHARRRGRAKRGGGAQRRPLGVLDLASEDTVEDLLAIDEALDRFEAEDAVAASTVRLRFFAGLSVDHVARVQRRSRRTVLREWAYARARLYQLLSGAS